MGTLLAIGGTGNSISLHPIDWSFIVWYLLIVVGVGVYYSRRAGKSLTDYFATGRSMPWWVLGTSMVATTFAADTPLAVSGLAISKGISGNWAWWCFLLGGTLTVFFFSRLWRRAEILTEVELVHIRYSGVPARILRGCKAVYLAIPICGLIFGWVTLAMTKVIQVTLGWGEIEAVAVSLAITVTYTSLSGLWGVVTVDVLQFTMAMIGAIILAVLSVGEVGGLSELTAKVNALGNEHGRNFLDFFPSAGNLAFFAFMVFITINWWAVYYPGAEPGGGGWVTQRMCAAKDERHAAWGTLWFTMAHYALRPWPWLLVGLCAMVLYPELLDKNADAESGYPMMMRLLPPGMMGLVLASFLAAYMSTIESILTLASSYLVNDLYKPFIAPGKSLTHYVSASRVCVVLVMMIGAVISLLMKSVFSGWMTIMGATAGTGLVLLLRWYWWRVNAWSEISAIVTSIVAFILLNMSWGESLLKSTGVDIDAMRIVCIVAVTTAVWITVTFLTRPTDREQLRNFFRRVRPGGWWGTIPEETGIAPAHRETASNVVCWISSTAMIFAMLFSTGKFLFGQPVAGAVLLAVAIASGLILGMTMKRSY